MTSPAVGEEAALLLIGILLLISGVCSIIKYILNPKRLFKIELGFGIISVIAIYCTKSMLAAEFQNYWLKQII